MSQEVYPTVTPYTQQNPKVVAESLLNTIEKLHPASRLGPNARMLYASSSSPHLIHYERQ